MPCRSPPGLASVFLSTSPHYCHNAFYLLLKPTVCAPASAFALAVPFAWNLLPEALGMADPQKDLLLPFAHLCCHLVIL